MISEIASNWVPGSYLVEMFGRRNGNKNFPLRNVVRDPADDGKRVKKAYFPCKKLLPPAASVAVALLFFATPDNKLKL